jgi:uncharacterized membrane protein YkoI
MNKKILGATGLLTVGLLAGSFMSIAGANAADATSTSGNRGNSAEELVTGELATTLGNLAKARVADSSVVRVEKESKGTAVYEVHLVKTDGTRVDVYFDSNNAITSVETKSGDRSKGDGKGQRGDREVVTGALATTLSDLAKARVTDGTVERVVKDDRNGAVYAVLMKKTDGTRVVVHFDASNKILSVEPPRAHGPEGHKGKGKGDRHGRG